jgi:hypothetical protein
MRCLGCGREWERLSTIARRYDPCDNCGAAIEQIFEHSVQATPFVRYFDIGLGREITSLGDRWAAMRGTMDPESGVVSGQLDYREKPSRGDLSARNDRIHERLQREARTQ